MFHFGSRGGAPLYGAILDIGSGSIGIAIVESNPARALPTIIYTNRIPMRAGVDGDARRAREAVLSATLTLSQDGLTALRSYNKHAKIGRMLATCGSPWSYTVARTVSYEDDEPFKVTKTLLHDLAESAEGEILSQVRSNTSAAHFEVVERATLDIAVNDYVVQDPTHQTGTVCSLSHMVGLIPADLRAGLNEVQEKLFPGITLTIHTYLLANYCVLRDLYPKTPAFTIIDVASETTEIGIVENNLLVENTHIEAGTSSFVRSVAETTGSPESDVESIIAGAGKNHRIDQDELQSEARAYIETVSTSLTTASEHRSLPHELVVTARPPYTKFFKDMLNEAFQTAAGTEPHVITLEHSLLHEVIPGVIPDTHLALDARFFHKLHGCGELADGETV